MASRGLDGLWQEMEDRTEAGFTVGEVSLVMKILRLAIQRILNRTNESMKDSKEEDVDKLREEVMKMRKDDPRKLQAHKDKYDKLLLQARQEGRTEEELEPFYKVGVLVFQFFFVCIRLPSYQVGIEVGFFLSRWQRPIDAVKDLRAQKVWSLDQLEKNLQLVVTRLKDNWEKVKEEGEALRNGVSWLKEDGLVEVGSWHQLHFMGPAVGKVGWPLKEEICKLAKTTCLIVDDLFDVKGNCETCTAKWSLLEPHTKVKPHCGPTNSR